MDNIHHLEGSLVRQGSKIGQLSLFFGTDDLGSIMLEENLIAAAGAHIRISQADMEQLISDGGFAARQRCTLYEPL